jgi:hypothetical protein
MKEDAVEQWIRFFLCTPRRFLTTLAVLALVVVVFVPGILALVVAQLIAAVAPLLGPALVIFIIIVAFRTMLGGGRRRH